MLLIKNLPFTNVVASGVATATLPVGMSYNRIFLRLGGTSFTKSMITDVKVRLNGKVIVQNTGARLDAINADRRELNAALADRVAELEAEVDRLRGERGEPQA